MDEPNSKLILNTVNTVKCGAPIFNNLRKSTRFIGEFDNISLHNEMNWKIGVISFLKDRKPRDLELQ